MMGMGMGRGMGGMGRGMGGGREMTAATLPNGSLLSLLTITVDRRERATFHLPERLSTFDASWDTPPTLPTRRVTLDFRQGEWLLDGRTFDMHDAGADETFPAGSSQIWEIVNTPGMMGMHQMAHPIHLHGPQFRILSREGYSTAGAVVAEGFVDAGWADTVLVMPGETVRIKARFTRHPGLYLYHCHILEHEDMGMMRNFRVTS
jgi:FtsP/CotA-like multicopper oxidase with cupredoxin domain